MMLLASKTYLNTSMLDFQCPNVHVCEVIINYNVFADCLLSITKGDAERLLRKLIL